MEDGNSQVAFDLFFTIEAADLFNPQVEKSPPLAGGWGLVQSAEEIDIAGLVKPAQSVVFIIIVPVCVKSHPQETCRGQDKSEGKSVMPEGETQPGSDKRSRKKKNEEKEGDRSLGSKKNA